MGMHDCPDAVYALALNDHVIRVMFADGGVRDLDCEYLFSRGVFKALKDKKLFCKVHTRWGAVVWNDELDIAPEHVYYEGTRVI